LFFSTVAAFFALNASAGGGAFEELLKDFPGSGYEAPLPPTAATSPGEQAGSLTVITEADGDIRILTKRRPPQVLEVLPDETIPEDLPLGDEVLPTPTHGPRKSPGAEIVIDPQNIIPADLKAETLEYYRANKDKLGNLRYLGVVDFAKHSSIARFYIADTVEGTVKVLHVAHGSGSEPDGDGYATIFSNKPKTHTSSLGFYLTEEIYNGTHGRSMRLHGLSPTNSNAYKRAIVIHSAKYVSDADNIQPGSSWGCLVVSVASITGVIDTLKDGALIYAGISNPSQPK
jgi:hypothetical protein